MILICYKQLNNKLKYIPFIVFAIISGTAIINNFGWDLIHNDTVTYLFIVLGGILARRVRLYIENPCKLFKELISLMKIIYNDNNKAIELLNELEKIICNDDNENNDNENDDETELDNDKEMITEMEEETA